MKQQSDGTYVTTDRPILFTFAAVLSAFIFAEWAWSRYQTHGLDVAFIAIVLGFAAVVTGGLRLPTIRFVFDPTRKLITWNPRSLMKEDGGQLQFSDVRNVVLQAMSGSESGITYRVAICTNDATLPLSFAYSGNGTGAERLATEIRSLLGMPTDTLVADSVAAMNESGRKIDAVLLQRDRR